MKSIAIAFLCTLLMPVYAYAGKFVLPEGKEIKVKFDSSIRINSGKLQKGLEVPIYLAEEIKIGGKTVIEAEAEGRAEVEEIVEASRPGDPGYIKVKFTELNTKGDYRTESGEKIKLAGVVESKGKGRKILSWLFILGLFISGQEGEIDTSQIYTATVGETVILQSD